MSTAVEEELMDEDVSPVQLSRISNGVDVEAFRPGENKSRLREALHLPDKKTIIYTGRLSAEKGVDLLVRSFSKVAGRCDCQLIIIGDGPEREYLLQLLDHACRGASVHLLTSTDDVADYLNASDLFILPSRFEGLSNSLLEAMACALPVISTRVGGSTDIISQGVNGLLIDADNEEEVHRAIAQVFDDPGLAARLGKKARETVEEQHDLSTVADRYAMVYKKLATNYHP